MVTGDNEILLDLARKLLATYDLDAIMEYNDLSETDVILCLIEAGLIDEEMPYVLG